MWHRLSSLSKGTARLGRPTGKSVPHTDCVLPRAVSPSPPKSPVPSRLPKVHRVSHAVVPNRIRPTPGGKDPRNSRRSRRARKCACSDGRVAARVDTEDTATLGTLPPTDRTVARRSSRSSLPAYAMHARSPQSNAHARNVRQARKSRRRMGRLVFADWLRSMRKRLA